MNKISPLINGQRHSWSSIEVQLLGRLITGMTGIKYEEKVEKKNYYGAGNMPVGRGIGNYEATASLTLHAYEVDAVQKSLPIGKRITDIEQFDITVCYLPDGQDKLITHVIRNCEFTGNKRELSQNDTEISIELELICSHIEWL